MDKILTGISQRAEALLSGIAATYLVLVYLIFAISLLLVALVASLFKPPWMLRAMKYLYDVTSKFLNNLLR